MKLNSKYIWDYDAKSLDLKNPRVLKWYLARKVNFGDWQSIDHHLLQKYLPQLDIDPTLKKMLRTYFKSRF